jgi:hypothetical protein
MGTHQRSLISVSMLALMTLPCQAGPCSPEIERMQALLDAKAEATAGGGRSATESREALVHRQPTPGSIAAAESKLGEVSSRTVEAVKDAMARARKADDADDKTTCEQALADVRQAIGP